MTTYVLVPGACHGAWCFDELTEGLRAQGHRVFALALTGVAERAHMLHGGVNLETHIADVLSELAVHDVSDAVLVGHSYGGMVITAVADHVPQQVNSLVRRGRRERLRRAAAAVSSIRAQRHIRSRR